MLWQGAAGQLSALADGSADGVWCLGRWMVTPSWTLPRSSSVPARSPRSPVMLARPWMSAGECLPHNLAVLGLVWPQRAPGSCPALGMPVSGRLLCPALRALSARRAVEVVELEVRSQTLLKPLPGGE